MSISAIRKRVFSKEALAFALLFAIVFSIIALAEYGSYTWQHRQSEAQDLHDTVDAVSYDLVRSGRWNLAIYRQAPLSPPSGFLIISGTGQLVDVLGDPSDLIRSAVPPDKYIAARPAYVTTDTHEIWLIQNRPVKGGNVIGGISADDLIGLSTPARLLARELAKYGMTMTSAQNLDASALRNYLTGVMLITDSGQVISSSPGVVPLRVQLQLPDRVLDGRIHESSINGHSYSVLSRRLATVSPQALILAFDKTEPDAAYANLRFNLILAGSAWLLSLLGYLALQTRSRLQQSELKKSLEITTRQLITQGENAPVEFKETLRRNLHTGKDDPRIEHAALKTIAAFLNTNGGILLIGVSDQGRIQGLAPDEFDSPDKAMLHLTNLIRDQIGSPVGTYIHMRVERMDNDLDVLRVDCRRSEIPAYMGEGAVQHFYVRTGPATVELPLNKVHDYIKTHFESH